MPVKRRLPKTRRHSLPLGYWELLNDAPLPEGANPFFALLFRGSAAVFWVAYREEILSRWLLRRPGTRPTCWWQFDAPRDARLRTGGSGSGEPIDEQTVCDLLRYPRLWASLDEDDPPTFESDAAYLKRHDLLQPGEARRLPADAFQPVPLPAAYWPTLLHLLDERTDP